MVGGGFEGVEGSAKCDVSKRCFLLVRTCKAGAAVVNRAAVAAAATAAAAAGLSEAMRRYVQKNSGLYKVVSATDTLLACTCRPSSELPPFCFL